jgi:hypothetical protein
MSFVTYRLKSQLEEVGVGATESRRGEVEAIIKQDHNEARGQIYSELVAYRLACLIGVEVACGALVSHDRGLRFASLVISDVSNVGRDIETPEDIAAVTARYPRECARIAVFDLWIGNHDRLGNLHANISR